MRKNPVYHHTLSGARETSELVWELTGLQRDRFLPASFSSSFFVSFLRHTGTRLHISRSHFVHLRFCFCPFKPPEMTVATCAPTTVRPGDDAANMPVRSIVMRMRERTAGETCKLAQPQDPAMLAGSLSSSVHGALGASRCTVRVLATDAVRRIYYAIMRETHIACTCHADRRIRP